MGSFKLYTQDFHLGKIAKEVEFVPATSRLALKMPGSAGPCVCRYSALHYRSLRWHVFFVCFLLPINERLLHLKSRAGGPSSSSHNTTPSGSQGNVHSEQSLLLALQLHRALQNEGKVLMSMHAFSSPRSTILNRTYFSHLGRMVCN